MVRKLGIPVVAMVAIGLAITGVAATWLRASVGRLIGKDFSDRNAKTDVTPVHW
jgi:hypothetical protein